MVVREKELIFSKHEYKHTRYSRKPLRCIRNSNCTRKQFPKKLQVENCLSKKKKIIKSPILSFVAVAAIFTG